jgi:hypothetical protein
VTNRHETSDYRYDERGGRKEVCPSYQGRYPGV